MAECRCGCTDPVRRIAQLLEIQHRQGRRRGREVLDQSGDRRVADAPDKIRFEIIAAAADEGFVEQRLDLAIRHRGDLVCQWRPESTQRTQHSLPGFDAAVVADHNGRQRIPVRGVHQRSHGVDLVGDRDCEVAVEGQRRAGMPDK